MTKIFNYTNLFYFLFSSNVWFAFTLPGNIVIALAAIIIVVTGVQISGHIRVSSHLLLMFLLILFMTAWASMTVTPSLGMLTFCYYFPTLALFMLPERQKIETLDFVTKWFSIILGLGLLIYLGILFFDIQPWFGKFKLRDNDFYPPYDNYFFYLRTTGFFDAIAFRYNGPFLEPGHLALVSTLIIIANRYSFKRQPLLWIPLTCILLSLSLAGYVLLAVGYVLTMVRQWRKVIITGLAVGMVWFFCVFVWAGGNNVVNQAIISRLEYDESKGITGNNRTTERTDTYYKNMMEKGMLWSGVGSIKESNQIQGAGYKIYFLRFGMISAFLVLLLYLMLIPRHANRRFAYGFLIVLILAFIQRAYPWWWSWLLCYTLSTGISDYTLQSTPAQNGFHKLKKFIFGH